MSRLMLSTCDYFSILDIVFRSRMSTWRCYFCQRLYPFYSVKADNRKADNRKKYHLNPIQDWPGLVLGCSFLKIQPICVWPYSLGISLPGLWLRAGQVSIFLTLRNREIQLCLSDFLCVILWFPITSSFKIRQSSWWGDKWTIWDRPSQSSGLCFLVTIGRGEFCVQPRAPGSYATPELKKYPLRENRLLFQSYSRFWYIIPGHVNFKDFPDSPFSGEYLPNPCCIFSLLLKLTISPWDIWK